MPGTVRIKLAAAFIAISLCVTWFFFMRDVANGNSHDMVTPFVFAADSHIQGHYNQLIPLWQMRIAGNWIAGRLCDAVAQGGTLADAPYENIFGAYNAVWLALTFAIVIFFSDNPVFVIPFIFAGMCYSLTPTNDTAFYAWDMPSMFCWTLSYFLWQRKHYLWMLIVIVAGTAFKETVAVTAFLFFFSPLNPRKRWTCFGAAFAGCLLLRLWISWVVRGHPWLFTAGAAGTGGHPTLSVVYDLLNPHINHFIWVNAGSFVIALFLPMKTLADQGTKVVLVIFLTAMTVADSYGAHYEFREFLDVLPISVLYLNRVVQSWQAPGASSAPKEP